MAQKSGLRPTRNGKTRPTTGQWQGDIRSFVDWCESVTDVDAYRTALAEVPPNSAWAAVSRSLRAEIEYHERPSDSGPRTPVPDVFRVVDPEGAELRDAKRKILEGEITRRALV